MSESDQQNFCKKIHEFNSIVIRFKQKADDRNSDDDTKWINAMVTDMMSLMFDMKHNPCIQWEFEEDFRGTDVVNAS